ncbi:hypothetical protein [Pantoea sp. GM01]|uniref:hypothetical protein n=1 Tax=Pantoea sp. GM01 TaxID=1144320 RepID=UPI0012F6D45B|nr:hypothetical protein [Pantoea sp. GM01]
MLFLFKNLVLFIFLMAGFLFISGAGVISKFFIYTPPPELSKLVVIVSSLLSFVSLARKVSRYLARKHKMS